MVNNTFLKERMIFSHQCVFGKISSGAPHDQSNKQGRNPKFKWHHLCMVFYCTGHHHLIEINPVAEDDQHRHHRYHRPVALYASLHQDQQWTQKVYN